MRRVIWGRSFAIFSRAAGRSLIRFCNFRGVDARYKREKIELSWRDWPLPERDPSSAVVAEFAAVHRERVEYFQYLQWEADRQLAGRCGRRPCSGVVPRGLP